MFPANRKMKMKLIWVYLNGFILIVVLNLLSGISSVSAQGVKAYVDRNPVRVDETLRLFIETDSSSGEAPDLRLLEKDFDLLGTSHSSQTTITNGQTTSLVRWVTTLAPKRLGKLSIPPIQVGGSQTQPLTIMVEKPSPQPGAQDNRDIFLEAEVDSHFPYIQGQVLLTLRLVTAVSLQDGKLDDPEIDWGIVERVGKDSTYETIRQGRRFQVTERRYAITPQQSGTQVIPPVLLSGSVPEEQSRNSRFDNFFGTRPGLPGSDPFRSFLQKLRPIHLRSPKVSVTVKNMPANVSGRVWLPAKTLTLQETWSAETNTLKIGDSLTRTVVIHAQGLRGEQLPELNLPKLRQVKMYPDKAQTTTSFNGKWVEGTREEAYALVPTQSGSITLPAIRLPWWNVDTEKWEEAALPARTLTIIGPPSSPDPPLQVPQLGSNEEILYNNEETSTLGGQSDSPIPINQATLWRWVTGGLVILWILTVCGWVWERSRRKHTSTQSEQNNLRIETERKAIKEIQTACLQKSARQTRSALLKWASVKPGGQGVRSLGGVVRLLKDTTGTSPGVTEAIWGLDRALYTPQEEDHTWDGNLFWETVKPAITANTAKLAPASPHPPGLPPLYPE